MKLINKYGVNVNSCRVQRTKHGERQKAKNKVMSILYVTASNLTQNTSAKMSLNGYVQGLVENGAVIDIVIANNSYGETDKKLQKIDYISYYEYKSLSLVDKIRLKAQYTLPSPTMVPAGNVPKITLAPKSKCLHTVSTQIQEII